MNAHACQTDTPNMSLNRTEHRPAEFTARTVHPGAPAAAIKSPALSFIPIYTHFHFISIVIWLQINSRAFILPILLECSEIRHICLAPLEKYRSITPSALIEYIKPKTQVCGNLMNLLFKCKVGDNVAVDILCVNLMSKNKSSR